VGACAFATVALETTAERGREEEEEREREERVGGGPARCRFEDRSSMDRSRGETHQPCAPGPCAPGALRNERGGRERASARESAAEETRARDRDSCHRDHRSVAVASFFRHRDDVDDAGEDRAFRDAGRGDALATSALDMERDMQAIFKM
jgi:hypothetical protein